MFANIDFKKYFSLLISLTLFTLPNHPVRLYSQEQVLLSESEMPGYELENESTIHWVVGEDNQIQYGIGQQWEIMGAEEQYVYINYCEFISIPEAIVATAFSALSHAVPYIWGSPTGSLTGDATWFALGSNAIYFIRGNIGIQLFLPFYQNKDSSQRMQIILNKLVGKISQNLSAEIVTLENTLRQKQIPLREYRALTDPVANSELMNGFSLHSTRDSKWLIDSKNLMMGMRNEWENEKGAIVGVDICKFESSAEAEQASDLRSRHNGFLKNKVDLQDLGSLGEIMEELKQYGIDKNISIVGFRENIAIHIYQYDSTGIDTTFFRSLLEKFAEQLKNF